MLRFRHIFSVRIEIMQSNHFSMHHVLASATKIANSSEIKIENGSNRCAIFIISEVMATYFMSSSLVSMDRVFSMLR